jgi:dGTPase
MLTRRDFEAREQRELAPYAAKSAASRGREHPESEHVYRTAYQRDRDRVVHSTAFRRLEYKTQVFLTHEGDFFRTRLTHTMEVAQIARTLARALNLNEDLTEAVALAHDLDDAIAMGIVTPSDLANLAIFKQAAADFATSLADLTDDQRIRRIAKLLIDLMASDAIATSERAIEGANVKSPDDVRAAPGRLVRLSQGLAPKVQELATFLNGRVYRHYRVARMMTKARRFITQIFEAYQSNPDQLPPKYHEQAGAEGLQRAICDYIAGMTDRYAQDEYQRLYEPFERV